MRISKKIQWPLFCFSLLMLLVMLLVRLGFPPFASNVEKALLSQKWEEARSLLTVLDLPTADPVATILKAYACLATADYRGATEQFSRLGSTSDATKLVDYASALARKHPNSALAHMLKGDALARSGKYDEALSALDEAVRLDQRSALLYDVRGVVRMLADNPDDASADFEKAIELDPRFADPLANLGIIRLAEGDFIGTLEYLNQAIDVSTNFAIAYNARGVLYSNLKAWEQSERDFQKAKELSPEISFVAGNLRLLVWAKGQEKFQAYRAAEEQRDGRGTTLVASAYERYSVDIGDGRTVDVINIKHTPQTATLKGMEATLRQITDGLRTEAMLPADWKPNVLIAQPGLGSSAYAERKNFAKMAFNAGKDFVICADMTDKFKWPSQSGDLRMLQIDEDVSRRFERLAVATKHVYGNAPDAVLESQATRMLAEGKLGSTTISDLYAQGKLHPDFELNKVVPIGVPLPGLRMDEGFRNNCVRDALAITTRGTRFGLIESEPLFRASSVEVWQRNNKPPSHGALFADQWQNNQVNPIPDLVGIYMRGVGASAIQKHANELRINVPMYTSEASNPTTVHLSMASMTRRGLTDPSRDAVLIGCRDAKLSEMMKAQYGDAWRVEVVPETDPVKLNQLAVAGKFTRINRVAGQPVQGGGIAMAPNAPPVGFSLTELRSLARNIDRFNTAVNLVYKIADVEMPGEMKLPLAFTAPIIQDLRAARDGQYNFATSQTLERIGRFGLKEIPTVVKTLKEQGKLPQSFNLPPAMAGLPDIVAGSMSQIGRGKLTPSVSEVTYYLDGINKACWATVGAMVGGPKGASIASASAGLAADILRETTQPLFDRWAHTPVRRQMIQDWRIHVEAATAHGVPAKTFTEMFGSQLVKQAGFNQRTVAEFDNTANMANALRSTGQTQTISQFKLPDRDIRDIPVIVSPRQDEIWKRAFPGPFPPDKFGSAGVPTANFRMPRGDNPGGVKMKADVVKGQPADISGISGGETSEQDEDAISGESLLSPFLLFCASGAEK